MDNYRKQYVFLKFFRIFVIVNQSLISCICHNSLFTLRLLNTSINGCVMTFGIKNPDGLSSLVVLRHALFLCLFFGRLRTNILKLQIRLSYRWKCLRSKASTPLRSTIFRTADVPHCSLPVRNFFRQHCSTSFMYFLIMMCRSLTLFMTSWIAMVLTGPKKTGKRFGRCTRA